jgi:parallel beta-helix repeat protein
MRRNQWFCFAVVAALAWFSQPSAWAQTAVTSCVKLSASGSYVVATPVTSTSNDDCIIISAPNVSLRFATGTSISGPGVTSEGAGIHILPSASEAVVLFGTVQGFKTGIKDEGSEAAIIDLNATGYYTGIVLDHVDGSKIINSGATGGESGIYATNAQDCVIADTGATGGTYGIWLKSSSDNHILDSGGNTPSGGKAGIYFGPSESGKFGNGNDNPGSGNEVDDSGGGNSTTSAYGIVIDKGEKGNVVASSSGSGTTFGLADFNHNCDANRWLINAGTRNQTCIQ